MSKYFAPKYAILLMVALSAQTGVEAKAEDLYNQLAKSTTMVNFPGFSGTGFYVKTKAARRQNKYFHVTAAHVVAKDWKISNSPVRQGGRIATAIAIAQNIETKDFEEYSDPLQVNQFDSPNDAAIVSVSPVDHAFSVVRRGRLPSAGDEFIIAGFPGSYGKFDCVNCMYLKTGVGLNGQPAYVFDCPDYPNIKSGEGTSGGPMVDYEGVAWGLVSGAKSAAGVTRVIVAPIFETEAGELVSGFSR